MNNAHPRPAIRPALPSDGEELRRVFSRLCARTIYGRFHAPYQAVPAWAERLFLDAAVGVSLVAVEGARIVGHAMYVPLEDGRQAEVGILVEDERQSRGFGSLLLLRLVDEARMRGVDSSSAEIRGENRRALALFNSVLPGAGYAAVGGAFRLRAPLGAEASAA